MEHSSSNVLRVPNSYRLYMSFYAQMTMEFYARLEATDHLLPVISGLTRLFCKCKKQICKMANKYSGYKRAGKREERRQKERENMREEFLLGKTT